MHQSPKGGQLRREVKRWGIYQVPDEVIRLPPESAEREPKRSRYFVAISDTNLDWVVGCPTSTDPQMVIEPWDVELPAGACGTRDACWVRIPAIQPVDKIHLTNRTGAVPTEGLRRQIAINIFNFLKLDDLA